MRNWGNLRINYLNNKAQSLTEVATFGSVLLLVLSFFISYGMRYLHQQDSNMRAFRTALADAYTTNRPDASSSLLLVNDKHIPNPRDTFGVGGVEPIIGQGDVVWGNTLQNGYVTPGVSPLSELPRIKFVINKDTHEYTTASYTTVTNVKYPDGFYVQLYGSKTRTLITWANVRCYMPEGDTSPQAMILVGDPQQGYETEIITEVAGTDSGPLKQVISVLPVNPPHGDPIWGFLVLDPQAGEINPDYFALNTDLYDDGIYDGNPDVTPANLQGYLPVARRVTRGDTLSLEERSKTGYYKSTDNINTNVEVTHKIGKNKLNQLNQPGEVDKDVDGNAVREIESISQIRGINGASSTWQTQK